MRIVILGPGRIGSTLARFFCSSGHQVMLSAYRDQGKAERLASELKARLGSLEQASGFGEVFFLCVPHPVALETARQLSGARGVLVDCTNQFGGSVPEGYDSTSEYLASQVGNLAVIKAFNTLRYDELRSRPGQEPQVAVVYSSDSVAAASILESLIRDCGYAPVNLGPLANGRLQEPGGPFFLQVLDAEVAKRTAVDLESAEGLTPTGKIE